ncbi:hypothetical protein [Burkholderia sp. Ac-20392]|uniref:hypothetical protein n=1 Tax=Burkholderia sp. Ac-20392 TaxID=2703905 RepID=UPI00197EA461|nr:hypothetical protein [Burkholderia sp. Ac-20392]MBN3795095.1 hypothetical protein [Burkholderia sp. Ac-20392]
MQRFVAVEECNEIFDTQVTHLVALVRVRLPSEVQADAEKQLLNQEAMVWIHVGECRQIAGKDWPPWIMCLVPHHEAYRVEVWQAIALIPTLGQADGVVGKSGNG